MVLIAGLAGPAAADRHCSPVLDLYYQSRQEIHTSQGDCAARLERATARLEEAETAARDCGCAALRERIRGLLDRLSAGAGADCEAGVAAILEFAPALDDPYAECL